MFQLFVTVEPMKYQSIYAAKKDAAPLNKNKVKSCEIKGAVSH